MCLIKKKQNKRDSSGSKRRNVSDGRADGRVEETKRETSWMERDILIELRGRLEPHVSA